MSKDEILSALNQVKWPLLPDRKNFVKNPNRPGSNPMANRRRKSMAMNSLIDRVIADLQVKL